MSPGCLWRPLNMSHNERTMILFSQVHFLESPVAVGCYIVALHMYLPVKSKLLGSPCSGRSCFLAMYISLAVQFQFPGTLYAVAVGASSHGTCMLH